LTPSEKLYNFFSQYKLLQYKKGETFLRAGDIPQGVFFIKKGFARLYSLSSSGKELTLVIYKPGEFFPVVFTFTKEPSIYYFETLSDCEIFRAPRDKFINFVEENKNIVDEIIDHIIQRFQVALRRMESLTFGNASARLASVLLIYAKRFGIKQKDGKLIPIPLTHKDIANLVGVARETVSIELKKFIDKGIVQKTGRFLVVKNQKTLEKQAE
jgi:CRP/FNR family transcriptional regulator